MKNISIPRNAAVLIVEDSIQRRGFFLSRNRIPGAFVSSDPQDAIDILTRFNFIDTVFLDYDLGLGVSSEAVARTIAQLPIQPKVYIHSANPFGRMVLSEILPNAKIAVYGEFEITQSKDTR